MTETPHSPGLRSLQSLLHLVKVAAPIWKKRLDAKTTALIDLELAPDDDRFWQAVTTLEVLLGKSRAYDEIGQKLAALIVSQKADYNYSRHRAEWVLNCIQIGQESLRRALEFQLEPISERLSLRELFDLGQHLANQNADDLADLLQQVEAQSQTYKPDGEDLQVAYELAEQGVTTEIAVAAIATSIEAEMTAQKCAQQFTYLERIATFDRLASAALVDLMQTHPTLEIRLWAAKCLVK